MHAHADLRPIAPGEPHRLGGLGQSRLQNIAPRIGFAYQALPKTGRKKRVLAFSQR